MIIKIQRPLLTEKHSNDCLVYNEDMSICSTLLLSAEQVALLFNEDEFKIYVDCDYDNSGNIQINKVLSEKIYS